MERVPLGGYLQMETAAAASSARARLLTHMLAKRVASLLHKIEGNSAGKFNIPRVLICGKTTPMAPPSRTLCTNPLPH